MSTKKEAIDKKLGEIKQQAEKLKQDLFDFKRFEKEYFEVDSYIESAFQIANKLDAIQEELSSLETK